MAENLFSSDIVCCYLYIISRYGYPPAAEETIQHLNEMQNLGFQSVELEGIREEHLMKVYESRNKILTQFNELNLRVPYFCIVLPGLSSENNHIREQNLKLFETGCQIAHLFNSEGVLDNAPLPPYSFPEDIPVVRHYDEDVLQVAAISKTLNWKKHWQNLISTYQVACEIAANYNLTYHMHPCMGVMAATSGAYLYFHDAVKRDNLRFTFDTANQYVLKENLELALLRLADHIDYIHLSDNRGIKVEHLSPGTGNINWHRFFLTLDRIDYKGHLGLDIGGEESELKNIEKIYIDSARWLENQINNMASL
jgi:sugar phosphate isomerase/epimerase